MVDAPGRGQRPQDLARPTTSTTAGHRSRFVSLAHTVVDQDHAFAVIVVVVLLQPDVLRVDLHADVRLQRHRRLGRPAQPLRLRRFGADIQQHPPGDRLPLEEGEGQVAGRPRLQRVELVGRLPGRGQPVQGGRLSHQLHRPEAPPVNPDLTPDVQRILAAKSDFVLSCMTVDGNVALARGIKQYGLQRQAALAERSPTSRCSTKYSSLLQGVYFLIGHVPLTANQKFPVPTRAWRPVPDGHEEVRARVRRATEIAIQGWESAALLVAGIQGAPGRRPDPGQRGQGDQPDDDVHRRWPDDAGQLDAAHTTRSRRPTAAPSTRPRGPSSGRCWARGKQVFVCFGNSVEAPDPERPEAGDPRPAVG